jgi:V8-like Glu-specific endopeptidase
MPSQTGLSRLCPSCGRRVPRNVTACRCGAALAPETSAADAAVPADEPESSSSSASSAAVAVLLVAAFIGAIYWFIKTPPTPPVSSGLVRTISAAEPAASPEARTESPEARAWNAQANARDVAPTNAAADAPAPSPASPGPAASIEEMVDHVMPAVVLIETSGGRGSGFFVSRDTLITNVHVVENDSYVTLRRIDGSTVNARVDSKAPAFDIAILKVAQPSATQVVIPMGTANSLKTGQEIIVIGSALGTLQNTVSRGIVSGLRTAGGATLVQTDAATNPGNSGGPMLDRTGTVIGITTMGYKNAQGLNFGVAIDHARVLIVGRLAFAGWASGGLIVMQNQSKASESERQLQQGNEQLRTRLGQLATAADRMDAGWQQYRKQCFTGRISGSYDREWFALLSPRAMPADAGAGCVNYFTAMDGDAKQFKTLMQQLLNDARHAGVLPGTIRDTLRQNRLDFDWER